MKEECLICKAPLEYFQEDVMMDMAFCHTGLGPVEPYDIQLTSGAGRDRRSEMLQKEFIYFHPYSNRIHRKDHRHQDGQGRGDMQPHIRKQPMHRQQMPVPPFKCLTYEMSCIMYRKPKSVRQV